MNAKRQKKSSQRHRGRPVGWFAVTASVVGVLLMGGILIAIVAPRLGHELSLPPPELPANINDLDEPVAKLIRAQFGIAQTRGWNADTYGELGLIYEANQLWQNAYDVFRSAVQLDPQNKAWRLHLAISAHEIGNFKVEKDEIHALVATHPDFAPALHRHGQDLLNSGDLSGAAATFARVIELEPTLAEGYVGLADVHLRQGEAGEALPLLQQALDIDPDYKVTHYLLGSAYRDLGREQEAMRHLRDGMGGQVRSLPDAASKRLDQYAVNVKARTTAATKQVVTGEPTKAAAALEEVLRADPENVVTMNNLAGAYARLNRLDEAEQLLQRARSVDPNKYSTYVNLANIAAIRGQLGAALAFADKAVELEPRNGLTHRGGPPSCFNWGASMRPTKAPPRSPVCSRAISAPTCSVRTWHCD